MHVRDAENLPELSFSKLSVREQSVVLWNRPSDNTYAILQSEVLSREIGDAASATSGPE